MLNTLCREIRQTERNGKDVFDDDRLTMEKRGVYEYESSLMEYNFEYGRLMVSTITFFNSHHNT